MKSEDSGLTELSTPHLQLGAEKEELRTLRREVNRYRRDLRISIQEQAVRDDFLKEARAAIEIKDRYIANLEETLAQKEAYLKALQEDGQRPAGPEGVTPAPPRRDSELRRLADAYKASLADRTAELDRIRRQLADTESRLAQQLLAFRTREDLLLTSLQYGQNRAERERMQLSELSAEVQKLGEERRSSEETREETLRELTAALRSEKEDSRQLREVVQGLQAELDLVHQGRALLTADLGRLEQEHRAAEARIESAGRFLLEAGGILEVEAGWRDGRSLSSARQMLTDGLRELGLRAAPAEAEDVEIAACTIVSKNYLSLARAWNASFRKYHPGAKTYVLLADRLEGAFDPAQEDFTLIQVEELGIPDFADFAFKYNILELNTAVKPYFLQYLFQEHGVERLLYFDPDILLFSSVDKVRHALRGANIVLIPHILSPIPPDGKQPDETNFLVSGSYNLGFIGLRNNETTSRFLTWWQTRVYDHCFSAPERGLFTDQKWMDLVPSLFPEVAIVKDPGYNAAYWNLHERLALSREGDQYHLAGTPLVFFHFSGLDPERPEQVSKHQSRFRLRHLSSAHRQLFQDYLATLRREGLEESRRWPYAFGRFEDGVRIPDYVRRLYHSQGDTRTRWPDPFHGHGAESFRSWLLEPARFGSPVPRILSEIYRIRTDLHAAFSDGEFSGASRLLGWAVSSAPREYDLDNFFIEHFRRIISNIEAKEEQVRASHEPPPPPEILPPPPTPEELVALRYAEPAQKTWKRALESVLRPPLYRKVRRLVWHLRQPWETPSTIEEPPPPTDLSPSVPVFPSRKELPFGVNLFGYFDTESGVGETARSMARTLERAGIDYVTINIEQAWLRRRDHSFRQFAMTNPYAVNLLMVNADQCPAVVSQLGPLPFQGRANVAFWAWELAEFPDADRQAFEFFDEIWTLSTFCLKALSSKAPIPVASVPPGFRFQAPGTLRRHHFGLEEDDYVFLFVFDAASSVHRKNPAAVVSAFRKAFPGRGVERLVLKSANARTSKIEALRRLAGGARVDVITEYMPRPSVLDLIAVADCYVSLHRSEGLGITLLEAMSLGKPVIATNYSGNSDFLHEGNGYPVGYRLVPIRRNLGAYRRGNVWADPDIDQAAAAMRRVRRRPGEAARKGARAAEDVAADWGLDAAARRLRGRLEVLVSTRGGGK